MVAGKIGYDRKPGYERSWSAAFVSVAGVLAMLIPPSNPFIIYWGVTETPVGPMFLAGILPGTLLVIISFHPETPSSLVGEGLPCGVRLNTPQGKGEGDENKIHLNPKPLSPPPWPSPIKGEGNNLGFPMGTNESRGNHFDHDRLEVFKFSHKSFRTSEDILCPL